LRRLFVVLASVIAVILAAACTTASPDRTAAAIKAPTTNANENINMDNRGEFTIRCSPNPERQVDPIISPGVEPSMHNHQPAGGEMTSTANFDSLMAGETSCHFNQTSTTPGPHSLMWVPVLKRNGVTIPPKVFIVYYRLARGHVPGEVKPFPPGLELFAGPQAASPDGRVIVDWGCGGAGGGRADIETLNPHDCDPSGENPYVKTRIVMPSCSNGEVRSADHRSHLAYPDFNTGCPASHPIQLPLTMVVVQYQTSDGDGLKLSSFGMMDIGGARDTGTKTQHGDYIAAWDQDTLTQLIDQCINAQVQCAGAGLP
jgi:hypothetical protein